MKTPADSHRSRQPWLPRFGLAEMMLAMMIFSVMGAAGSYLMRALGQGGTSSGRAVFVIFTLAAPIALVLLLSCYTALKRWLAGRGRR